MKIKTYIILIITICFLSCNRPDEKSVSVDYNEAYPERNVISATPGEGDSDNIYFQIKYTTKGTENIYTDIWLYQKDLKTKEWILNKNGKRRGKVIRGYFDKTQGVIEEWTFGANPNRDKEIPFKVPRFDYTLSEWINTCLQTGWTLEEICEPNPTEELIVKDPSFKSERIVALFIIYRWRKPK